MLELSFLINLILLFPTFSSCAPQVAFSAHHELALDAHHPLQSPLEAARDVQFRPSSSYPLPPTSAILRSRPTILYRPRSLDVLHRTRLRSLQHAESDAEQVVWDKVEVEGPDVSNLHTLAQLARMSANAYALPSVRSWYEVDDAWNVVRAVFCSRIILRWKDSSCGVRFLRASPSVGKRRMVSEGTSSSLLITQRSCSPSRVRHSMGRPQSWTSSMTTCKQASGSRLRDIC